MAIREQRPGLPPALWSALAVFGVAWVGLIGAVQPSGVIEVAAVLAVAALIGGALVWAALALPARGAVRVPVRAVRRRTPSPDRLWDADAPGRPRPRAPGEGCSGDSR